MAETSDYLTVREVADLLRLKERKVYDLVKEGRIPCLKVTGKWLFPRARVEQWIAAGRPAESPAPAAMSARPGIVAGSRDPWLDWCIAESGCGLATRGGGSLVGLDAVLKGEALAAGLHLLDPASGDYNQPYVAGRDGTDGLVLVEWARREQGLVLPPGNPLGIAGVADLVAKRARVAQRPATAGAAVLLQSLLALEGRSVTDLTLVDPPHATGFELGLAVLDGRADAGLATRAVARRLHLDFLPLRWERFDLLLPRRDWFEPPFQTLLRFARSGVAQAKAADLSGYDLSGHGMVWWNGA
ncbi:helix-turn-helix transcriptional regulator [Aerophototrophica crusticola]|uniref:Helix-turn-helix transcriptional regulator n=1 Tax=Aerophototrophica crusticola TaxID=1709002 RepID=A0A858R4M6_9PROT|nr:helix-turn-helix transcriptional regulator [Rhodospirillaceae bacterium B3]